MKKLSPVKLLVSLLFLILGATGAGAQTDVYVSHRATAAGDGSVTNPYSLKEFTDSVLMKAPASRVVRVFFERGGSYPTNYFAQGDNYGFSKDAWKGKTAILDAFGSGSPVVFDGSGAKNSFFLQINRNRAADRPFTLYIKNIIFQHYSRNEGVSFITLNHEYNAIHLENITIQDCNNADAHLFYINNYRAQFSLSNSSIIRNNRRGYNLIRFENADYASIYNNTFSGNTLTSYGVYIGNKNVYFVQNTLFNTRDLHCNTTATPKYICNNLATGTSSISFGGTSKEYFSEVKNNFSGTEFRASGKTADTTCTMTQVAHHLDTLLTDTKLPGGQFHNLKNTGDSSHLFMEAGDAVYVMKNGVDTLLTYDQAGNRRTKRRRASLGSIDRLRRFALAPFPLIPVFFDPATGTGLPLPKEIDLKKFVLEAPEGADLKQARVTFISQAMKYGTLSAIDADGKTTFTPRTPGRKPTGVGASDTFTYKISQTVDGKLYEDSASAQIRIVDSGETPGCLDTDDYPHTCFDFMGSVTFSGGLRFRTAHEEKYQVVAFSIPLIADLNKDGYPEIIAFGKKSDNWDRHYRYIRIFNGQTGAHICDFELAPADFKHAGWHPSPAPGVLVDANRDGIIELIMAFPPGEGGGSPYAGKVVSFSIKPAGSTYTLEHNVTFPVSYGQGLDADATLATPQVCDLDGDGTPEILVYNKVYDAVTGELLFIIDPDYMGRNPNAWYDKDRWQAFPYIYDLDGDGIYDIAAGGKLYRITKPDGRWQVEEIKLNDAEDPGDGFTGVADVDGDGRPDIVTVRMQKREQTGDIAVTVWNPNFSAGVAQPKILARKLVNITHRHGDEGSHSYVYMGDINGAVYNGKRLPEIAILSGRVKFTDAEVHPTVKDSIKGTETKEQGAIFALTFDELEADLNQKLKFSFFLEHKDSSDDTGFTMFDFDNDGVMEIAYRDKYTQRIIKPVKAYITANEKDSAIILVNEPVNSETGFEYPVVADIDHDASAEVVVMGKVGSDKGYGGYVYAFGNKAGDKFAPARPVWNQFVYDPFKINDDLTTPLGPAKNRLTYKYLYEIRNNDGSLKTAIDNYQPYNATLNQTPYVTLHANGPGKTPSMEPIIFLTESYLTDRDDPDAARRPAIVIQEGKASIRLTVGNRATAKTAISGATPVSVYENDIAPASRILKERIDKLGATSAIQAGQEIGLQIPVTNPYAVYYVRLGDDSGYEGPGNTNWRWRFGTNNEGKGAGTSHSNPPADAAKGIGKARRAYRDCNWQNQSIRLSLIELNSDAVTVQQFGSVSIPILLNDRINITDTAHLFPTQKPGFKMSEKYIRGAGPTAGTLIFSGDSLLYVHNGTIPPHQIDTFSYAFTYKPAGSAAGREFSARVYIYIMQPADGVFAACHGSNYAVKLKESPAGVRFAWRDEQGTLQTGADSLTIDFGTLSTPKTYRVKPLLSLYNGEKIDFAPGKLTPGVWGGGASTPVLQWTGYADADWNNPHNWTELKKGLQTPASFAPAGCVDVILPAGLRRYPQLTGVAACAKITLQNRAMIAGVHWLAYQQAQVELKLAPAERDRFIMWSAPLMNMYSGDYHFKRKDRPQWGDVYINFFQAANPDNPASVAAGNYVTPTFGHPGVALRQGQAFNLKLMATSAHRDSLLVFPKPDTAYTTAGASAQVYRTPRGARAGRFTSDTVIAAGNRIAVAGAPAGSGYMQVANPFMAYLNIRSFLQNNPNLENAVKIWNGKASARPNASPGEFITILPVLSGGNRYVIDAAADWFKSGADTVGLIAPLQSFFVKKANPADSIASLNMNPDWTSATVPARADAYTLRAREEEKDVLRIQALWREESSSAVLFHHPEASPDYKKDEDACKLFSSETPLSLYTLSPQGDPLAIQASNSFQTTPVRLGIRLKDAGQVTFQFSGMETFGYRVWLVDRLLNGKKTDVALHPQYTFTVSRPPFVWKDIEINDRFTLEMQYAGPPAGMETLLQQGITVTCTDGRLLVDAPVPASGLRVYALSGALIYGSDLVSCHYETQLERTHTYIVTINLNGEHLTAKLFAR